MRRRAALLISKWVSKLATGERPAAYHALLTLLAADDAALQLAAISSLQVKWALGSGTKPCNLSPMHVGAHVPAAQLAARSISARRSSWNLGQR